MVNEGIKAKRGTISQMCTLTKAAFLFKEWSMGYPKSSLSTTCRNVLILHA